MAPCPDNYHNRELPDSTRLGRNLVADGQRPAPGDQAHHMVPGGINYGGAPEMRAILKHFEIGINDAANGVWLPDHRGMMGPDDVRVPHHGGGVHSKAHLEEMLRALRRESTREGVIDVLHDVREALLGGELYRYGS